MSVYRSRPLSVVTVHRDTMLNGDLSTTSRLLYAVLVCSLDVDLDYEEIATLVGAKNADDLQSYLEELVSVGAVEMGEHVGKGPVLTVHEIPLVPAQRTHACVPCQDCGDCSCEYIKGICQGCYVIRETFRQAQADIARWKSQLEAGATYAMGQNATRLHRWNCPTLNSPEKGMERLEEQKPYAKRGGMHWSRLPNLFTAEELRLKGVTKRNCATCGPDPL
ncbi:hypothetical protein [Streptomyces europaeiscabiei]|uniref:hypothetical protein n=1 Tax=Streptomyces europaeiscabiei TaxID=146819 RepID=UPI002E276BFC|nr:hypothetical protein OG858_48025 [Streptomyces europaeiscabiei]